MPAFAPVLSKFDGCAVLLLGGDYTVGVKTMALIDVVDVAEIGEIEAMDKALDALETSVILITSEYSPLFEI